MEAYKSEVATAATVFTLFQFLTGTTVCRKFFRTGTTGEVSSTPFVAGALNNVVWVKYGLARPDRTIVLVNGTGTVLYTLYVAVFHRFAAQKGTVRVQIATAAVCLLFLLSLESLADAETALNAFGFVGCGLVVFFMASPLANLSLVIRTSSTETLPFPMIVANAALTSLWTLYGSIVNDNFILVPNFLGFLLAIIQLALFAVFPSRSSTKGKLEKTLHDTV